MKNERFFRWKKLRKAFIVLLIFVFAFACFELFRGDMMDLTNSKYKM